MTGWETTAAATAERVETPFYLASADQLERNIVSARQALQSQVAELRLAYSVKTNYLASFILRAQSLGELVEVVSFHEFMYVRSLGVPGDGIVVNGPAKSRDFVRAALESGARLNLDSVEEAHEVAGLTDSPARVGIRVAASLHGGATSRFGVDFTDTRSVYALRQLVSNGDIEVAGLHVHHSSQRDASSFADRVRLLGTAWDRLHVEALDWVDIGGGFSSLPPEEIRHRLPYPISTWDETAEAIGKAMTVEFGTSPPMLILEPGIGLLADTMAYVSSVRAVKRGSDRIRIVSDGSMFETNPLRSAVGPPISVVRVSRESTSSRGSSHPAFGATCMEIDHFGEVHCPNGVDIDDLLLTTNVGAYAMCLAPEFIVPKSAVVCADTSRILRDRQSLGDLPGGRV